MDKTGQLLEIRDVRCMCGAIIDRVSTNVLGMTTNIKCDDCGRINRFIRSLHPEPDTDTHPPLVASLSTDREVSGNGVR